MSKQYAGEKQLRPTYNPPIHHKSNDSSDDKHFFGACCGCCSFLLLFTLFILFYPLVFNLVVHPKQPEFNLHHVGVKYLHIGPNNKVGDASTAPAAYITLGMKLLFAAVNHNKWLIWIEESTVSVSYRGEVLLGTVSVPRFDVPANSTRLVESTTRLFERLDTSLLHRHNHTVEIQITALVRSTIDATCDRIALPTVPVDCVVVINAINQTVTYKKCSAAIF